MNEEQIKHMVNRFLGWKLPENFNPDNGISFKPTFNDHLPEPMKREPSGTNLFDYMQADAMVRHMLEGLPLAAKPPAPEVAIVEADRLGYLRGYTDGINGVVTGNPEKDVALPTPGLADRLVTAIKEMIKHDGRPGSENYHAMKVYDARENVIALLAEHEKEGSRDGKTDNNNEIP